MGVKTDVGDAQRARLVGFLREFRGERHYLPSVAQISVFMGMRRNECWTWRTGQRSVVCGGHRHVDLADRASHAAGQEHGRDGVER
jgi:hypothetical protein